MSKELTPMEALKRIKSHYNDRVCIDILEDFDLIEKSLKALEIIKEKNVNVGDFKRCKSLEDYNDYCCYSEKEQLTQEEYDLLKEVLS